jgi:hypothetical protein
VSSWGFLEVCIQFLDQDRFRLGEWRVSRDQESEKSRTHLTWTFAWHSAVRLWIRDPDTPGGFNASMAWRPASSSATAEDMMQATRRSLIQINNNFRRVMIPRMTTLSKSCVLHQSRSWGYDEVRVLSQLRSPRPTVSRPVNETGLRDENTTVPPAAPRLQLMLTITVSVVMFIVVDRWWWRRTK